MVSELDDYSEVLLIEEGLYKSGFSINNKEHFPLMFGSSSRIGLYNVLFYIRHEFLMKSVTPIKAYSIRKGVLQDLLNESP